MNKQQQPDQRLETKTFEIASELRVLAARARHLASTLGGEPGRLRDYRWDISIDMARDLLAIAERLQPATPTRRVERVKAKPRTILVNGRKIRVQPARLPFAVHV